MDFFFVALVFTFFFSIRPRRRFSFSFSLNYSATTPLLFGGDGVLNTPTTDNSSLSFFHFLQTLKLLPLCNRFLIFNFCNHSANSFEYILHQNFPLLRRETHTHSSFRLYNFKGEWPQEGHQHFSLNFTTFFLCCTCLCILYYLFQVFTRHSCYSLFTILKCFMSKLCKHSMALTNSIFISMSILYSTNV